MSFLKSKWALYTFCLLLVILLSSCNPSANASAPGTYSVNPTFADFYRETGGISLLGPAISPSFEKDGRSYQYVVSGLMVYDPSKIPLKRFYFSPIASVEWGINDLAESLPTKTTLPYVNGHQVWDEVLPFFTQYSADIIGLPLTGVKANEDRQRYEQYFEGLGFYRNYSDPPGQLHLLPYGSWMCAANCQYQAAEVTPPTASYVRDYSETEQVFLQESDQLGYGFTGEPLAPPKMAEDTYFEMVFQNVVMYIDPSDANHIKLRPLPAWLGIKADKPGKEIKTDWLSFYPISDGRGFNIPNVFIDYVVKHGGMTFFGDPITEYKNTSDGGYTQCFISLCLEYYPTAPEPLRIRPHNLGKQYYQHGQSPSIPESTLSDALEINAWEQYALIPTGQRQTIYVEALRNGAPVTGIQFSLVVTQPDGITRSLNMNPTGEDGRTSIDLDPINGPNGAIVQYKVCMLGGESSQICFSRSYTIWNQ